SMQEIANEAALYAKPESPADIAEKMMLLYKDEKLRSQLIEKGRVVVKQYSWEQSAERLWQSIEKAIQQNN
ncbi:MAG TPA: hypothetical protein PK977_12465, partial [Chitinophagaceae bacterium]|nr:hypothetical protein [Chitinophagaceae bacterium]